MTFPFRIAFVAIVCVVATASSSVEAGVTLKSDDFGSGSVSQTFRIYENTIDNGWYKGPWSYSGQPASAWTIAGGVAKNDSSLAAGGYPNSKAAEAPLFNFFSGGGTNQTHLRLEFDYSVADGDSLFVHLWGLVGTPTIPGDFVSNIEASANGNVNLNAGTGNTTGLTTYNLKDGASSGFGGTATSLSGELTGVGRFVSSFGIADLGIPGVSTAGDIDYYLVQFAKSEDGSPGTTEIDHFQVTAVPEPGSLAMFAVATLGGLLTRRRRQA